MKKISHQRLYQLKNKKRGLCVYCGKTAWRKGSEWCEYHRSIRHTNQFDLLKTLDNQMMNYKIPNINWDNFYANLSSKHI
jgi:hypothetical protein